MQWFILGAAIGSLVLLSGKSQAGTTGGVSESGSATNKGDRMTLKHFTPDEFGSWWPLMNQELLQKLDNFRERWGAPVVVSPAEGGIGRHMGEFGTSQHNIDAWGEVRAIDVFPMIPLPGGGYRYMQSADERQRAYEVARAVGFTGIGLYTDTQPGNMLHVDVRPTSTLATWSRINGNYEGIGRVLA